MLRRDSGLINAAMVDYRAEVEAYMTANHPDATETDLRARGLSDTVMQRHAKFVEHYESNWAELTRNLNTVATSNNANAFRASAGKALGHLNRIRPPKRHVPLDPNNLPHRAVKEQPAQVEDYTPRRIEFTPISQGLYADPVQVASAGDVMGLFTSTVIDATASPTSADLAETVEVRFTAAIANKAADLGHNPLNIYNWVRNNVDFVPTYGSIQGADYCLQTLECNAFDTSSLLIALLRASGIHARYAMGTVELDIDRFTNWVGGFTNTMAALDFASTGGIKTTGLREGGVITRARIEHVWVEAWIDMIPSMGAVHKVGDTWTPLDASFKQYVYTKGMDLATAVPFDAETLVGDIINSATVNEAEGWVTGVDSGLINAAMADYRAEVEAYMTANHPDATVGDVLGYKRIEEQVLPIFPGTLPNTHIATATRMSALADAHRLRLSFTVEPTSAFYYVAPFTVTYALPELAGKKITLSYSPATQADEDVINSFLPAPHADGTPIDPSELPTSLPAYMINLKPELRVDGAVVATGGAIMMGSAENVKMAFHDPTRGSDIVRNRIKAGSYWGVGLAVSKVSREMARRAEARLTDTKARLKAQSFEGLTKDDLLGELLYTTAMMYDLRMDGYDTVLAHSLGVRNVRLPSEAVFKTDISVSDSFGVPISASATGLVMDADRILSIPKALDGSQRLKLEFMRHSGINSSAFEHLVPEQLWSTSDEPVYGVSAVKALELANAAGVPIYVVTGENVDAVLPQIELGQEVKDDIRAAVAAGNEVMVPKTNITYHGWTGCGYVVTDPTTGAGAYMITGGDAGAYLIIMLLAVFALIFMGPILAGVAICLALTLTLVRLVTWFAQDVADASVGTKKDWCGPEGSPFVSWLIPEVPFGTDLRHACKNHDECYAVGTTNVDKLTCDGLLGVDANDDCNAQGNDHLCGLVAFTYQFAVTFFAWGAFYDKK